MAAATSHMHVSLHGPFEPVWTASRQFREGRDAPGRGSRPKKNYTKYNIKSDSIDPGSEELNAIVARAHKTMHRVKAGQGYEEAAQFVYDEEHPPLQSVPGDWFPDVSQVYVCMRKSVDSHKVEHFCDILGRLPFLFKAIERIKESWLTNTYPLPMRIVRALDRDNFDLISANFTLKIPLDDANRYPGAFWMVKSGDPQFDAQREARLRTKGGPRRDSSRRYSRSPSSPFYAGSALYDPTALPRTVVAHRREWNHLLRRYMDDWALARQLPTHAHGSVTAGGQRPSQPPPRLSTRPTQGGRERRLEAWSASSAAATAEPERPVPWLMEPLFPVWQLVEEQEQGERRISDLQTTSADDAKLIMQRCCQIKAEALRLMDEQYKAKIAKVEDNTQKRYRRKLTYLVPPYRTAGADMPAIRRRVQRQARHEDVVVRYAAWYTRLQDVAFTIGAAEQKVTRAWARQRCQELMQRLQPVSRMEGSQCERGKEKLCLLLMSLPFYEALQPGLQMAVLFMHVHLLSGSENVFRRWLRSRSLLDGTLNSPLLDLLRTTDG